MKIAYFFSTFPLVAPTSPQRGVRALNALGITPILVSNRTPMEGKYHPSDKDLIEQTFYLDSVSKSDYLFNHIKRFIKFPRRYLKGFILIFTLKDKELGGVFLKNFFRFAGAVVLSEYLEKKSIFHVHVNFAFGAAGVAIFLKAVSDITYSVSVHGSDALLPEPLIEEKLKQAKFIISICNFHVCNLTKRYHSLNNDKFFIVPIGIDSDSGHWRENTELENDEYLRILNVARLESVKGHDILIKALYFLKEKGVKFKCKIAGDGSKRVELENLINKLDLTDSVFLLGSCYESDVAKLFDWSHIFVLSSISEGTPMAIIEAMMKERPVVAPNITAIPEMVIDGETGFLFEKANVQELSDKLLYFYNKLNIASLMGKKGKIRAEKLFNSKRNAEKLVSIFRENIDFF